MQGGTTAPPADETVGFLHGLVLGVVEGLTEFLPVSSTGHLIVANRVFGRDDPAMEVAIQAGAITAIAVLYRARLWRALTELLARRGDGARRSNLLVLLLAAAAPAAALGTFFLDEIERFLFTPLCVALSLVAGGVGLWLLEWWHDRRPERPDRPLEAMTLGRALLVGVFQCLALIPGTSRSGATIAGGLLLGFGRTAAAEFSFLVGLPILYGAALLKLVRAGDRLSRPLLADFLVASVAAFVTALLIVRPFVAFLRRHSFRPFAAYRIVFGCLLLVLIGTGYLTAV